MDEQPNPVDAFRVYSLRSARPKDESLWGLAAPSAEQVKDCMPHVDGMLEDASGWLVRTSDRFVEVPISWSQWFEGTPTFDADGTVDGHQIDLLNLNPCALKKMDTVNLRKVIFRLGAFSPQSETVFSRAQGEKDGEEIRCLRPTALALMVTAFLPKNDLFVRIVGNQADKIVPDLLKFRDIDFFAELRAVHQTGRSHGERGFDVGSEDRVWVRPDRSGARSKRWLGGVAASCADRDLQ